MIVIRVFSPGLITAVALFLPLTAYIYYTAGRDGVLSSQVVWISSLGGFCLMLFPIVLQKTKHNAMVMVYQGKDSLLGAASATAPGEVAASLKYCAPRCKIHDPQASERNRHGVYQAEHRILEL